MKYQFVRCNKDLPKAHKMSRRYRVMMKRRWKDGANRDICFMRLNKKKEWAR